MSSRSPLESAIESCIAFIYKGQENDGSFVSWSGDTTFTHPKKASTTFYTSLILSAIHKENYHPRIAAIAKNGIRFLLKEKDTDWTWNYWKKDSKEYTSKPYPNDLDDTACALASLKLYHPEFIDGSVLANITHTLIHNEEMEGGPYHTWIVPKKMQPKWRDIDLVVNSNIGYFLKLNDINLINIFNYVEKCIQTEKYVSKYYQSVFPILYFISRYYNGDYKNAACEYLIQLQDERGLWENDLSTALAVCALLNFNVAPARIKRAINYLCEVSRKSDWHTFPFYLEENRGRKIYSGSPTLTAAFALEALSSYVKIQKGIDTHNYNDLCEKSRKIQDTIIKQVKKRFEHYSPETIEKLNPILKHITENDPGHQITLLPFRCMQVMGRKTHISESLSIELGAANLLGWLAYRIYDDLLDGEGNVEEIPLANTALREVITSYHRILSNENLHTFHQIMDNTEKANLWERHNCSFNLRNSIADFSNIPSYSEYNILADKSLGHALGPLTITLQNGYPPESQEFQNFFLFFKHYIIARQLNDDAHDWQSDLERGFYNSSSVKTLGTWLYKQKRNKKIKNISSIDLEKAIPELQSVFWNTTIVTITKEILTHITIAKECLKKSPIQDATYFEKILEPIEKATNKAITQRKDMLKFLKTY